MLNTALLSLRIHEWFHCSAGRGIRSGANTLVQRDGALPYVPGRTLKGLLRDAVAQAEYFSTYSEVAPLVPAGATNVLFGVATEVVPRGPGDFAGQRLGTRGGLLGVGNAVLPLAWQRWGTTDQGTNMLHDLAQMLHRTAIGDDGVAERQSLRSLEVMPPMSLEAVLVFHGDTDPFTPQGGWWEIVREALPLLRALGAGRGRGLGRVTAKLHTKLPAREPVA